MVIFLSGKEGRGVPYFFLQVKKGVVLLLQVNKGMVLLSSCKYKSGTSSSRQRREWYRYFFLQVKKGVVLLALGSKGRGTSSIG